MNNRRVSGGVVNRRNSTNTGSDDEDVGSDIRQSRRTMPNFPGMRRAGGNANASDDEGDGGQGPSGPLGGGGAKFASAMVGGVGKVGKALNSIRRKDNKGDDDEKKNKRGSKSELSSSFHETNRGPTRKNTNDDDDDENDRKMQAEFENEMMESESASPKRMNASKQKVTSLKANETFARRRASTAGGSGQRERIAGHDTNILDKLPVEYRYNPKTATPVLHFLPRLMAALASRAETVPLRALLKAAEGDVQLHRARVQAALERDMKLIRSYKLDHDPRYKERCKRLQERKEMVADLKNEKEQILKDLKDGAGGSTISGLTQAESAQLQLVRWQRALELYVYDTSREYDDDDEDVNNSTNFDLLNWQSVFEKLLDGISEDQDISQILMDASEMCQKIVRETEKAVDDASQYMADLESAYVVRLEAHEMFARSCLQQVNNIEEQFRTAGQAALRIGHQLESAESKRSQCEAASILIRRWWIMESLAEQEVASGEPIPVEVEMNGGIPPNACRLDHLFTKRENSLEASKALKQLRAVVRSRGNAAASGASSAGAAMIIDKSGSKRLDITSNLITRVSDTLETRLLNQFSIVYNAGGNYDFSMKPRAGAISWKELRSLAQALLLFDSGRNLHKRYVEMVLENRFPELFDNSRKPKNEQELVAESMTDANLNTFDMDATRAKLSTLFHRVSEVCTAEFELIAHVFSSSDGARSDLLDGSEEMPLVVARALLQRVISDQNHGLQARINDLLASIDRLGDFESGAKKLDTFVIIHEKAASLFNTLRDAADRMMLTPDDTGGTSNEIAASAMNAVEALKGFLTSQELALSNQHRQSYINLELRLLHHDCCSALDIAGCTLVKKQATRPDNSLAEKGILEEYRAPILPLHKPSLEKSSFNGILTKPLKQAILRQPLIHATDSLARARLMFGANQRGGEATARVILSIYNQMCCFYGTAYLYPIVETLKEMLPSNSPTQPPSLPFNEDEDAHDLGINPAFWVALERIHSAAKSFDRELWAENTHNQRVWETLDECGDTVSMNFARSERAMFYSELERRGESAILRALETISTHVHWILVTGGESMLATGGSRMLGNLTGGSSGGKS